MNLESLMLGYRWGSRAVFVEPPRTPQGTMGNQLARTVGSSLEFMDHREYWPGDDTRRIDWNAFARSDKLTLKLYREEVNPHVDLLLDVSKSMNLAGTRKGEAACALAGFFASAAAESRFSFRVFTTDDGCRPLGRSHLSPMEWDPFDWTATESPADALTRLPPGWRPRGIRILVSDLLFPTDPETIVPQIIGDAAVTLFVQLLAGEDLDPSGHGHLRLVDCESYERLELYLDDLTRNRYKRNLAAHQEHYDIACRRHGAFFTMVAAESFLESGLLDELFHAELLRMK